MYNYQSESYFKLSAATWWFLSI